MAHTVQEAKPFLLISQLRKSSDVDHAAAQSKLPLIHTILAAFAAEDQFNCYEYGLCYKQAPTTSIGPGCFPEQVKSKERIPFMVFVNADWSEHIAQLVTGHAKKLRFFHDCEGWEIG